MLDFSQLSPLMRDLHAECVKIYYLMLPVFFALAIALQWFGRSQAVDLLDILKRTIVSTLLLIAFPEITSAIITVTEGVASRIDSVQSFEKLLMVAQDKINSYTSSPTSILLQFSELITGTITFLSFLFVYIVRYLTLAMFHFFWLFLVVTAPLLLLFNIFAGTSQIVTNLFRGLVEVACWKIVWAILGVMLTSMSFGKMYLVEGSYVTVTVMNIVIAIAMLSTPMIVRGLVGSGIQATAPTLAFAAAAAILKAPALAARSAGLARTGASMASQYKFKRSKVLTGKDGYEYSGKA